MGQQRGPRPQAQRQWDVHAALHPVLRHVAVLGESIAQGRSAWLQGPAPQCHWHERHCPGRQALPPHHYTYLTLLRSCFKGVFHRHTKPCIGLRAVEVPSATLRAQRHCHCYTFRTRFVHTTTSGVAEERLPCTTGRLCNSNGRGEGRQRASALLPGRADGYPSGPPTDPYVRNSRIRFLKQSLCYPPQSTGVLVSGLVSSESLPWFPPMGHSARRRLPSRGSLGPHFPTFPVLCAATTATLPLSGRCTCRSLPDTLRASRRL